MESDVEPTELQYAYFAGILDGEGYIGSQKANGYWRTTIEVAMTHRETIDWIRDTFGGYVYTPTVPKPNARQYWKWTITGKPIRLHLPRALPYMITKKQQAGVMIEILQYMHQGRISSEQEMAKEELCLKLKTLNKRGLASTP